MRVKIPRGAYCSVGVPSQPMAYDRTDTKAEGGVEFWCTLQAGKQASKITHPWFVYSSTSEKIPTSHTYLHN